MLKKLLKYDLEWIYKVIIVLYILAFIFSIIGRGLTLIQNSLFFDVLSKIAIGTSISLVISALINCIIRLWARFVRNIYKDESYLTHTIPVPKKTIYLSKVLTAITSIILTIIVGIICLFICYYSKENLEAVKSFFKLAEMTYNIDLIKFISIVAGVFIFEIIFLVIIGYVGIIIGHKSNKNKMLISIVASFAIYMIFQTVNIFMVLGYGLFNSEVMNLINTTEAVSMDVVEKIMYASMGIYTLYTVLLYVFGKKELEKGVNVD